MSLKHAILGFLGYRSRSGSDLERLFDGTVRHIWPADYNQIHRTLSRLEQDGHVCGEYDLGFEPPDRREFDITDDGRAELKRWLSTPLLPPETREAALIQLFFAGTTSDQQALDQLRHHLQGRRMGLAHYEGMEFSDVRAGEGLGGERDEFYQALTLDHRIAMMRAEVAWLEGVVALLEDRVGPGP